MPSVFQPLVWPRLSKTLAAALATCLLALASPAPAQQPAQASSPALKEACKGDYKALCPGVQPGGGRIVACLKQNADKVSAGCKQALTAARSAKQAAGARP